MTLSYILTTRSEHEHEHEHTKPTRKRKPMEDTNTVKAPAPDPVPANIVDQYTDLKRLSAVLTENGSIILARSGRSNETGQLELIISVEHASNKEHSMHVGFAPPKPVNSIPTPGPQDLIAIGKRVLTHFGTDPETI